MHNNKLIAIVGLCIGCGIAAAVMVWSRVFVTWGFLILVVYLVGAFVILEPWHWPSSQTSTRSSNSTLPPPPTSTSNPASPSMQTTVGGVERSQIFIALLFGGGLLLLCSSLLYQVSRDHQELLFAQSMAVEFDHFFAQITSPNVLLREPPSQQGLPLTIELLRTKPASLTPTPSPTAMSYTLIFSPTDGLIFSDAEGKPVPPRVSLSADQPLDVIYLRQDLISAETRIIELEVREAPGTTAPATHLSKLPLVLEGSRAAFWRLISARSLGDAALPLTIAIAIVGWGVEANRRQREEEKVRREKDERDEQLRREKDERDEQLRREKDERDEQLRREKDEQRQQEIVTGIIDILPADPVRAIARYSLETGTMSHEHNKRVQDRITLLKNTDIQNKLLIMAGDYLRENDTTEFTNTIHAISQIFQGEQISKDTGIISTFISNSKREAIEDTAKAIERTYTKYYISRGLCVISTQQLLSFASSLQEKVPLDKAVELFHQSENGRGLLRESAIISILKSTGSQRHKDIAEELPTLSRSWNIRLADTSRHISPSLLNPDTNHWWKDQNKIDLERLTLQIAIDKHIFGGLASNIKGRHIYIRSGDKLTSTLITSDIISQMNSQSQLSAMPVELSLPFPVEVTGRKADLTVHFIAQAIGELWFSIVCTQPEKFFNLHPTEQRLVLRLLAWMTGSYDACWLKIDEIPVVDPALSPGAQRSESDRKLILHELRTLFSREGCPNPTSSELRFWMRLRPKDNIATLLLAHFEPGDAVDADIKALLRHTALLEQANVYLVLCGSTQVPIPFHQINLSMDTELFRKALNNLITAVNDRGWSFDDLIRADLISKCQTQINRLIVKSNGSLSLLLEDVDRVVTHHVGRFNSSDRDTDRRYEHLSPEDFDAVLADPGPPP